MSEEPAQTTGNPAASSAGNVAAKLTFAEATETLTGWDEIAIEKASGYTIEEMSGDDDHRPRALHMTRCVAAVFVARSKDMKYADAYREVMGWPQVDVQAMFEDEPDDVMPDDPDSAAGKDEWPRPAEPPTWPASASQPA